MNKSQLCWAAVLAVLVAVPSKALGHRRLLHGGSHSDSEPETGSAQDYLTQLQAQGITPDQRLIQVLGVTGLDEDGINTLLQDVQG